VHQPSKNVRYPSVLTPYHNARESLPVYYDPGMSIEQASGLLEVPVARLTLINRRCMVALAVIFTHAMRAAEYLRATAADVIGMDRLLVHGCKGSGSYIVVLPGVEAQFGVARSVDPARFVSGSTYRQLWTACVRIGIGDRVISRENAARTHAGRYRLAAELEREQTQTVSDVLRHRSQRSTLHYMARGG
jgi:integrase